MTHENKVIGFVRDVRRDRGMVIVSVALVHDEVVEDAPLLGEFVVVKSGRRDSRHHPVKYLGMVADARYSPIAHKGYDRDLALVRLNSEEVDRTAKEQINFMEYDIVLLGLFDRKQRDKLNPGVRFMPSLVDAQVERMDADEAERLLSLRFVDASRQSGVTVAFGHLAYGTDPEGEVRSAKKFVSASFFQAKRTANFGKTGTGKSNENKIIITLLAAQDHDASFLIFDANGEYAIRGAAETEPGLAEAFKELGIRDRMVLFSNRQFPEHVIHELGDYVSVHDARVNFYEHPEIAIALAYNRSREVDPSPPQYLEEAYNNVVEWKRIPNRRAYLLGALRALGLQPPDGCIVRYGDESYSLNNEDDWRELKDKLENGSARGEGNARKLYMYRARLAFLKPLHTPETSRDVFRLIKKKVLEEKKVVVLDMPSLGDLAEFIANRLAADLLEQAIDMTNRGMRSNFVILLEEAHRYLSDKHNAFYKIAKEGRKFGIGMLYSTQSPHDVPMEILSQTENFLVKHVSSMEDVKRLVAAKAAFDLVKDFLLFEPAIGLTYLYSDRDQPFPVSLRIRLFSEIVEDLKEKVTHTD